MREALVPFSDQHTHSDREFIGYKVFTREIGWHDVHNDTRQVRRSQLSFNRLHLP